MNRRCKNDPNKFCFICGKVTFPERKSNITRFVRKSYHAYFGVKLGDQDKAFAPHICCKTCVESLRRWRHKKIESLPFGIPMVWREGRDHTTDCYFCMTNLQGINRKNKQHLKYPDVPSAIKPVPHGPGIPIPTLPENCGDSSSNSDEHMEDGNISDTYQPTGETSQSKLFSQAELNDLTRDLCLSKESAQLLGSRLHENNLLAPGTTFSYQCNPSAPFDNKNVDPTQNLEHSDDTTTSVNPQCKRSLNDEKGAVKGNQSIPGDEEATPIKKILRSHTIVKPHNVSSEASVSNVSVEHDRDADVTVEKRMFHCDICEGIYSSAEQLKTHMKFFHSYEKPHQLVIPVHKQLEGNAEEINDPSCLVRNEIIYLKEECIDPVYVKEEFPEPVFVKEEFPEPVFVKEEFPEPVFVKEEFPEPVFVKEECTEPVCVKEEFLEPRYMNGDLIETIYVKEECIDPTYGGGVY